MQVWPTFLPKWQANISPVVDGSVISNSDVVLIQRQRHTARVESFNAGLLLSSRQLEVFEHFCLSYLHNGVDWFIGPFINAEGVVNNARQRIINGDYTAKPLGAGRWQVSLQIEVYVHA